MSDDALRAIELQPTVEQRALDLKRVRRLTRVMDERFLDPILGLVLPAVGDAVGTATGLYAVWIAIKHKAPKVLVARMLLNLGVDGLLGAIPILGDVFDFTFKAQSRNLKLLQARFDERGEGGGSGPALVLSRAGDWFVVAGAGALVLAALAAPLIAVVAIVAAVF